MLTLNLYSLVAGSLLSSVSVNVTSVEVSKLVSSTTVTETSRSSALHYKNKEATPGTSHVTVMPSSSASTNFEPSDIVPGSVTSMSYGTGTIVGLLFEETANTTSYASRFSLNMNYS